MSDGILDANGQPAEDKFRFYIEALLLGRQIVGFSYSQQPYEGRDSYAVDISLDNGKWLTIIMSEPPTFLMDINPAEGTTPQRTM